MERRDFLRAGVLAWAGLSAARSARAETPGSDPAAFPVVLATWDFGRGPAREAYDRLRDGGDLLDAVQHGVMRAEADPAIDSVGIGGLPNRDGVVELDAALMDGRTLAAGGVGGLRGIKHPIAVARRVMQHTPHVLLVGDGARRFAVEHGFEEEDLLTDQARGRWEAHRANREPSGVEGHDTLGLVARHPDGRLAAACSTSGRAWKLPGRVGDSPLVGHGLYCDDRAGGAVASGVGEEIIRVCGSYQVVEFMRQGLDPGVAVRRVLQRILRRERAGGSGQIGLVALRADGQFGFGALEPGFRVSVSGQGRHVVLDAPSLRGSAARSGGE